jgi:hypothetical protein
MTDIIDTIVAKGHKIDPEEFAAAAKELRESDEQTNTACRHKLEQQLSGYKLGYKDGLKVGIAQGRYEMGEVEWVKLNTRIFFFALLGTLLAIFLWTLLSYADQLPALLS